MLTVAVPCRAAPCGSLPIVDLRQRISWRDRAPARLATGALWLGGFSLLGPAKLMGLLLAGSLLSPGLLWLDRHRPMACRSPIAAAAAPATPAAPAPEPLPRAVLAADLGLGESQLFRARHAAICTVHHDGDGRIVELAIPAPTLSLPRSSHDAHPVG